MDEPTLEQETAREVARLARQMAKVLRKAPWMYQWGDADGGFVFATVSDALLKAGFDPAGAWQPTMKPRLMALVERDGWSCHYCQVDLGWGDPARVTPPEIEHVTPKAQGGTNDLDNLVLSCKPCNSKKRDQTPEEWLGRPCCAVHAGVGE